MEFSDLITALLPIIAGALTTVVMGLLRKVSTFVDGAAPIVKQLLVVVIAFGVTQLNALLGLSLPGDLLSADSSVIETLITALLAFGVYNIFPKKGDTTA